MSESSKIDTNTSVDEVPLRTLLETICAQFNHVAEIHILHLPTCTDITELFILVDAVNINFFKMLNISSATQVIVDTGNKTSVRLPYAVATVCDGPGNAQSAEGTTVYLSENVSGTGTLDMETGLALLRKKLNGICPTCGAQPDSLSQHYLEQSACWGTDFSV